MKKVLIVIVLFALFVYGLSSCSGGGNDGVIEKDEIVGKWSYYSESALDAKGKLVSEYKENNGSCPLDTYEFMSPNTYNHIDYDFTEVGKSCSEARETLNIWSKDDNTFRLAVDGKVFTFKVIELTKTALVLEIPLSREVSADYELNVTTLRHHFKRVKN